MQSAINFDGPGFCPSHFCPPCFRCYSHTFASPLRSLPSLHFPSSYRPLPVWRNVYGFDMSVIRDLAMMEPLVDTVQEESMISDKCAIMVRAQ